MESAMCALPSPTLDDGQVAIELSVTDRCSGGTKEADDRHRSELGITGTDPVMDSRTCSSDLSKEDLRPRWRELSRRTLRLRARQG